MNLDQSKEAILTLAGKALANTLEYKDVTNFVLAFRVGLFDAPQQSYIGREVRTSSSSSLSFSDDARRDKYLADNPHLVELQLQLAAKDMKDYKSYLAQQTRGKSIYNTPTQKMFASCSCGDVGQESCHECGDGFNTVFEVQGETVSKRKVLKQRWT